jgi:hypothetical protein
MKMKRIGLIWTCLTLLAWAAAYAGDPLSPLYRARLDATLAEWESATPQTVDDPPGGGPVSVQPMSFCVLSVCGASFCCGSVCVSSECIGSVCVNSACTVSGCVGSICFGSACAGSICGGSLCIGESLCIQKCGATGRADPVSTAGTRNCAQP